MHRLAVIAAVAAVWVPWLAHGSTWQIDPAHTRVQFSVRHLMVSTVRGDFSNVTGTAKADDTDLTKSSVQATIDASTIDTRVAKRDEHLKSPDFFNAKEFPVIRFKSNSAKAVDGGYEVAGDLTLHGATKPLTIVLKGGRTAEFPRGVQRTGYVGEFTIKRSDYGMDKMLEAIGDEIQVQLSFEGTKK